MESLEKKQYSYVSKPKSQPYIYDTIVGIFLKNADKYPGREIFIYCDIDGNRETITYGELKKRSFLFAGYLISKGIEKGDHVALFGPNSIEYVIAELGIIIAGGISVHLAVSITDTSDIITIFRETKCTAFLIDPGQKGQFVDSVTQLLSFCQEKRSSPDAETSDFLVVLLRDMDGAENFPTMKTALEINKSHVTFPELYPEDICIVFTTSGSTGRPKMVPHSHFAMINPPMPTDGEEPIENVFYNDRPFGWLGGSPLLSLLQGQPRVFTDASVAIAGGNMEKVWKIIKSEKCTGAILMPYFLCDLISKKDDYKDPFKLKFIFTGGQIMESYYAQVIGVYTEAMMMGYGSTEVLFVSMHEPIKEGDCLETGRVGTIGEGVQLKIVDYGGRITHKGQSGEICVKSELVFNGYYENDEATKATFLPGGWMRTGDIGYIKEDNSIVVEGRVKDVISRGTRKVMPHGVEDVISEMKGILHVVVVAVPDKRLYEEVCACFVVKDGFTVSEKDVERFCSTKMLKSATLDGLGDIPTYYLKFENFPCLASGKPNKTSIKLSAIEKLNLEM
ncbi:hypothetical protein FSP39_010380 [Pinctada imbricata]|uniref:Uncharacterized protein n=1 Tax=Pinctada imbricata TaxID=66713 RepID=A0AA88YEI9_PINIB|nr:hypothetical protein FSP39_010380 [Pinctada imbricata]